MFDRTAMNAQWLAGDKVGAAKAYATAYFGQFGNVEICNASLEKFDDFDAAFYVDVTIATESRIQYMSIWHEDAYGGMYGEY